MALEKFCPEGHSSMKCHVSSDTVVKTHLDFNVSYPASHLDVE